MHFFTAILAPPEPPISYIQVAAVFVSPEQCQLVRCSQSCHLLLPVLGGLGAIIIHLSLFYLGHALHCSTVPIKYVLSALSAVSRTLLASLQPSLLKALLHSARKMRVLLV
jgi:hypothetical protein